jgi:hypothetical protein
MTTKGIVVGPPLTEFEGVLTGVPRMLSNQGSQGRNGN